MKRRIHSSAKGINRSFATNILLGVAAALIISFALSALLTSLVMSGKIEEARGSFFIFGIRLLSVMVGCLVSTALIKEKHLPVVGCAAAGYLIVIVGMGIVFYDSSFQNFLSGVLSVLAGAIAAMLIKLRGPVKRRRPMPRIK